jgi:uncharacterized protein (DUF433 family)
MSTDPLYNAVESRLSRSGQLRSFVAGTRVRVLDIYAIAELQGQSADQVAEAFPQLSLAQIHAALAYLFANRDDIVREFQEEEKLARQSQTVTGPGPLGINPGETDVRRDSVSS